ncbi:Bardet-Biedl syndrome 10 protein isoform X2 [Trichomycterus rosablanca]|uniref:Bardet-Biedl syndrome 10 protein isoform X2 n=1 Tax=Trichomycterus rosablanca TaxID=2290929 RepID=UPI002F35367D
MAKASLSVAGALECVVQHCIGPDGGSVLFTKDTGEMLITRHGQRILTTLRLDHPIARTVLECVSAHDHVTADGSKSFILLLAALLREIRNSTDRCHQASCNLAYTRKLANQFLAICCNELDGVIAHGVVPYASSLFELGGCELEGGVLSALVGGYMAGRVNTCQAAVLTPVLCELYNRVSNDANSSAKESVLFLHSNFSSLCTDVPGLPSSKSHVVEGLVLAGKWSVLTETEGEGPVKALVVCENLAASFKGDDSVTIYFQKDWMLRSESLMQQRLAKILQLQVNVLLSSVKQSDLVLEWARLNSISVLECCDSAQLDLLCELTAAEVIPQQPLLRVATLTHCSCLQIGGCKYANLGIPPYKSLHMHSLVLCAPTPGALEQSVSVSRGVFAMLQHLTQSFLRTREQSNETPSSSDSHVHQIDRDKVAQTHESQNEKLCGSSLLYEGAHSSISDQSRESPLNANFWDGILKAGAVVPVGGAFEFLLHHSLSQNSNHGDSESKILLAKAILSVPRLLNSHKPRYFLQQHAQFLRHLQLLKQGRLMNEFGSGSESQFGFRSAGSGSLCVEPVCSKQHLVASVLQCVNRLLCVGTILHTTTSLHKSLTSFSKESEEEMT